MSRPPLKEKNILFRNLGDLKFDNVAADWGLDHDGVSIGASATDVDRDGDLDLIVSHLNEPLGVYRNNSTSTNRILVRLQGNASNQQGIGARVTVETATGLQVRQIIPTRGYVSADEPLAHFGLGQEEKISRLTVSWPSGCQVEFTNLAANRFYTITEPETDARPIQSTTRVAGNPRFTDQTRKLGLVFNHQETPFDDYVREPLLPNKLSQLGPGMAWADVNGDDRLDCFIGGAAGQSGQLFVQNDNQSFEAVADGPWQIDNASEDMGVLFFDFDSDGDEDLYVVSGGNEFEPDDPRLQDRLYLNSGNGKFQKADDEMLPADRQSGSSVAACDFDRDGDLDLFVGARMIPGRWPLAPRSSLLRNDGDRLVDITDTVAPELANVGLITGVVWSDIDADGWNDLLVALEWGPITVFRNQQGSFQNVTDKLGLATDTGWWNGIAAADVDEDGDMDFVATNFGLNTKYHASQEHPAQLFAHDFDGNGKLDLVEAEWEEKTCYPVRGRSCSSHAMPFIEDKFESYHEFGLADLTDIYSSSALDEAHQFQASRLESVVIINNGDADWEIRSLPRLAQASPGFGVVASDFNADGHIDIYFVQNFMEPQPETGQMDGGLSALLEGDGTGNFRFVPAAESGLVVPQQGMGATTVDLNQDSWPDLAVTTNNGPAAFWVNQPDDGRRSISVFLAGNPGNLSAAGSRVTVQTRNDVSKTAEVQAGSGYLSQSSGSLFFGIGPGDSPESIRVRWPDGSVTDHEINGQENSFVIPQK